MVGIFCRRCGERVSERSAVFPMGESCVFLNPHGILHELVTVRRAENLAVEGPATTEFSWYAGYAWRIAWCARCGAHLGWEFVAVGEGEPRRFWGLRRAAIGEG